MKYGPVLIEIDGRFVIQNVICLDIPGKVVRIGSLTLAEMDLLVDSKAGKLVPNPEHAGKIILVV